ncbi:hypothetical protein SBOR_1349 [Sclerotinia borealis F-4128]|uniref:Uncharacterized protein n=1 Tax=Sclerotinia borealis (strain F-4128) TaxID=1432307 RepID=W9CQC4_SCLBF|nr:hypothetical protein SBOR_1349 [Sclerotinia borealis F-4128]
MSIASILNNVARHNSTCLTTGRREKITVEQSRYCPQAQRTRHGIVLWLGEQPNFAWEEQNADLDTDIREKTLVVDGNEDVYYTCKNILLARYVLSTAGFQI